jgi:hypothetical protein
LRIAWPLVLALTVTTMQAHGQAPSTKPVSLSQFRELAWLTGRWRGSGRFSAPFYEQYRFRDDSTIAMTAYTDSTFQVETSDSSVIEWRHGEIQTRTPRSTHEMIEYLPTSIRFRRVGTTDGGHRFTKISADEWVATIFPRGASKDTITFQMRRVPGTGP